MTFFPACAADGTVSPRFRNRKIEAKASHYWREGVILLELHVVSATM